MNKGIVMEKHHRYMIVMTSDGEFLRTKNRQDAEVGEEVSFIPSPTFKVSTFYKNKLYSVPLAIAILLLMFVPTLTLTSPDKVFGVVTVDINPSIGLSVDDQYLVIKADAYNSRGLEIVNSIEEDIIGKNLPVAVEYMIEKGNELGYLQPEQDVYISSFVSVDDQSWGVNYERWSEQINVKFSVNLISINVDSETMDQAQEISLSPARYLLYSEAKEKGVSLDLENVKNTSISDLEKQTGQEIENIIPVGKVKEVKKNQDKKQYKNINYPEEKSMINTNGNHMGKEKGKKEKSEDHPSKNNPGKNKQDENNKGKDGKKGNSDHKGNNGKKSEDHPSNNKGNSKKDSKSNGGDKGKNNGKAPNINRGNSNKQHGHPIHGNGVHPSADKKNGNKVR